MPKIKGQGYEVEVDIEKIIPEEARKMLEKQSMNRHVSKRLVKRLKTEILEDKFEFNGEGVLFDQNGMLIDGQHRLTACVEADKPIIALTVRGIHNQKIKTIDMGKSRVIGDLFIINGHKNGANCSTVARLLFAYQKNFKVIKETKLFSWDYLSLPAQDIYDFYIQKKSAIDFAVGSLDKNSSIVKACGIATLAFCRIVLNETNKSMATDFFECFLSGHILNPTWKNMSIVRDQFITRNPKIRIRDFEKASIIFGLWNILQLGASVDRIAEERFNIPIAPK